MAGIFGELAVAGQIAVRTMGRRLRSEIETEPDSSAFVSEMQSILNQASSEVVAEFNVLTLPATQPPWVTSDVRVEVDQEVSYLLDGRVYANRSLDIWIKPALQIWARIGDPGEVFRGTRSSHSFVADREGPVQFGNYFPNDWSDPNGARLQGDDVYSEVRRSCSTSMSKRRRSKSNAE